MFKRNFSAFRTLVGLLLVVVMAAGIIGCGESGKVAQTSSEATNAPEVTKATEPATEAAKPVTLKMLTWSNPATIEYLNALNEKLKAKYPNITVEISEAPGGSEYDTLCQTRIAAKDVDIITRGGLKAETPDWALGADPSQEHQWIEGGVFEDISGQPFIKLYYEDAIKSGTYKGKVYGIPTGSVAFTGVFYNKDIFAKYGLSVPKTFNEFEKVCTTLKDNKVVPLIMGQADGWPRALPQEAIQDAFFAPDTLESCRKMWAGEMKYTDPWGTEMYDCWIKTLSWMDPNFTALGYEAVPAMFAEGQAAMLPDGTWHAPNILQVKPDMNLGYFPFPATNKAENNDVLRGKYDLTIFVAASSNNKEAAFQWIDFFSEKENYKGYCDATFFTPTQPGVEVSSKFLNEEVIPRMGTFKQAIEKVWFNPAGMGNDFGLDNCYPMGNLKDAAKAAEGKQKEWDAAMAAMKK